MPTNAIFFDRVDAILSLDRIAEALVVLATGGVVGVADTESELASTVTPRLRPGRGRGREPTTGVSP